MLGKISIRNFKCLRDVQIDLERFTVFVGPNASGKSSILLGLDLLCQLFRPQAHVGPLENELSRAVSFGVTDPVELVSDSGKRWFRYRTRFFVPPPTPDIHRPSWLGDGQGVATDLVLGDWKPCPPASNGELRLPLSVLLRLEASKLIQQAPSSVDPTAMAPDGTGLHSALASMALNDPDSWQQLQADLRRIIPTIRRLRHSRTFVPQQASLLFDTVGGDSLPASQVSEGTLLVLGLLAVLHAPDCPSLVLLDDLDRGLHPRAQRELISLLRGLLETKPDLQFLATTHSPYLLDCMEANEVRMTILLEDGTTVCAPLTAHPQFKKWKDEMAPGEMWSLFGEKWLKEQEANS